MAEKWYLRLRSLSCFTSLLLTRENELPWLGCSYPSSIFFSRNLSVSIKFVCYTVISLSSALIFMFSFDIVPLFVIKSITVFQNVLLVAKFLFLSICLKYRSRRPERCSLEKVFRKYAANWQENTMPKYDFNKVAKQLYWNHTSAWVFSFKVAAYFQNNFS